MLTIIFDNGYTIDTPANWFKDNVLYHVEQGKENEAIAIIPQLANAVVIKTKAIQHHKFNLMDAIRLIEENNDIPVKILKHLTQVVAQKNGGKNG